jgi:membrane protein
VKPGLERFDAYQQAHSWIGFPLAVLKKFRQDKAWYLGGLVAYYAFFSLFPLLLILVSVLGFLLGERSGFRERALDSVLSQIPVIGSVIRSDVESIQGSGFALVFGFSVSLLAGLGVVRALQHGMDQLWNVPLHERPNLLIASARSLLIVVILGAGVVGTTLISGLGAPTGGPSADGASSFLRPVAFTGALALNFLLFMAAFKMLTSAEVSWRDVLPGAGFAAVGWALLQVLGRYIIRNELSRASAIYGLFAIVIGLLSWLFVGAQLTLLAAEINVVRSRRLWPRNLYPNGGGVTEADRAALAQLARQAQGHSSQEIQIGFDGPPAGGSPDG